MQSKVAAALAFLVGGLLVLVVAVVARFGVLAAPSGSHGLSLSGVESCAAQESGSIAIVGRLAPGHQLSELRAQGLSAVQAVTGADPNLVVLVPVHGQPLDQALLLKSDALISTGSLRAQTSDRSLRSCHHRLSDNPAAAAIAQSASSSLLLDGLLTPSQLDAASTTFLLTDDPTRPDQLLFIVTMPTIDGGGAGSLATVVATIDRASGKATGGGIGHIYEGQ